MSLEVQLGDRDSPSYSGFFPLSDGCRQPEFPMKSPGGTITTNLALIDTNNRVKYPVQYVSMGLNIPCSFYSFTADACICLNLLSLEYLSAHLMVLSFSLTRSITFKYLGVLFLRSTLFIYSCICRLLASGMLPSEQQYNE